MIVVGEPSGDAHAASLIRALHDADPDVQLELFGATGPQMRAAGVETVVNSDDLAIMGILEVTRVLPKFLSAFNKLKQSARCRRIDRLARVQLAPRQLTTPPRIENHLLHQSPIMGLAATPGAQRCSR